MKIICKIVLLVVVFVIASCVPAKRYYEIEQANAKYLKQLKSDSLRISSLVGVNGNQMMKIMALSEDSIRLHYAHDSLKMLYKRSTQHGSMQIANIKRELDNKDLEVTQTAQKSQAIIYTFTSFDVEANTIYRQLSRYIQRYSHSGAKIDKSYWNVVVSLPDNLIFTNAEKTTLSQAGKNVISSIINLVKQYPKYHIDIAEYSRPEVKRYMKDSVITYKVNDKLIRKIQHPDSVGVYNDVEIDYSYDGFRIDKVEQKQKMPVSMNRGTAIVEYIESLGAKASGVTYSGTVYTYMPKQLHEPNLKGGVTAIIINPKTSLILRDIGAF